MRTPFSEKKKKQPAPSSSNATTATLIFGGLCLIGLIVWGGQILQKRNIQKTIAEHIPVQRIEISDNTVIATISDSWYIETDLVEKTDALVKITRPIAQKNIQAVILLDEAQDRKGTIAIPDAAKPQNARIHIE